MVLTGGCSQDEEEADKGTDGNDIHVQINI